MNQQGEKMNLIEILEDKIQHQNRLQWLLYLTKEKFFAEKYFRWLKFEIDHSAGILIGQGNLFSNHKSYEITIRYSPFYRYRYDKIFIKGISYHRDIHMYPDASLCLYHPFFDKPAFKHVELFRIIPWISEWIVFYEQWRRYGVWLGKEIKHNDA